MIGGGKKEDVTLRVEIPVTIVYVIPAREILFGQIVAGVSGTADGALRLERAGQVISAPGVKAAEFEQFCPAVGTPLVAVGKVRFWDLSRRKLVPECLVILRRPPRNQVGVHGIGAGRVLQCLTSFVGGESSPKRPSSGPLGAVEFVGSAHFLQRAYLNCSVGCVVVFLKVEVIVPGF